LLGHNENIFVATMACVALALLVGVANGVLVAVVGITPLSATLGVNSMLFGAALVYTNGAPHGEAAEAFHFIGSGSIFSLPVSTLIWFIVALLLVVLSRRTVIGRWLYAVGSNSRAARLKGVPVERTLVAAYSLSSLMACFGGLLLTSFSFARYPQPIHDDDRCRNARRARGPDWWSRQHDRNRRRCHLHHRTRKFY
jgi:ribose transport system permease protein